MVQINASTRLTAAKTTQAVSWITHATGVHGKVLRSQAEVRTSFSIPAGDDSLHIDVIDVKSDDTVMIAGILESDAAAWTVEADTDVAAVAAFKNKLKKSVHDMKPEMAAVLNKLIKGN